MARGPDGPTGEALDRELAGLLAVERFDPPEQFGEHALLSDPAVYERAAGGDVTTLRDPAVMAQLQEHLKEHQAAED